MYIIEREFYIAIGHALSKHKGNCHRQHGHNISIMVSVQSETLDENDMVMDFGVLKELCNKYIEPFDHSLLLNENSKEVIDVLKKNDCLIHEFSSDPTAEVLCKDLYGKIKDYLCMYHPTVQINSVTIYENEKSNATYIE